MKKLFNDAYGRKQDQFHFLLKLIVDLGEFGITPTLLNLVLQFPSEMVDPKADLTVFNEKDIIMEAVRNDAAAEEMVPIAAIQVDGKKLTHALSNKRNCICPMGTPLCDKWDKFRCNFNGIIMGLNLFDDAAR